MKHTSRRRLVERRQHEDPFKRVRAQENVGIETDFTVKQEIETGLALAELDGNDVESRLEPATSGTISFDGADLRPLAVEGRARVGIGYVPQGREIFPQLTVEENLRVGLAVRKDGRRTIPSEIYDLFPVLRDMLRRRGGDLSGGQQQQLAIGRALVLQPALLILDEPTEGIQPNIVHEIGDILLRLNREMGLTVLLVEQKLPFARRIATGFCILEKGRSVAEGPIDALTDDVVREHLSV